MGRGSGSEFTPWRLDSLLSTLLSASTREERMQLLCELAGEAAGAVCTAILVKDRSSQNVQVAFAHPRPESGGEHAQYLDALQAAYADVLAETPQSVSVSMQPVALHGLYVPLGKDETSITVLGALVAGGRPLRLQNVFDVLQMGRSLAFLLERAASPAGTPAPAGGTGTDSETDDPDLAILDVLGEIYPKTRFLDAALSLCAATASQFHCNRVALGTVTRGQARVVALDQMDNFAKGARRIRLLEEAMQEAVDQDSPVFCALNQADPTPSPPPDGNEEAEDSVQTEEAERVLYTRATRELLTETASPAAFTIPLRDGGAVRFVLLLELTRPEPDPAAMAALSLVGRLVAPKLRDLHDAEAIPLKKAWRWLLHRSADIFGPRRTTLKLGCTLITLLLAASLLIKGELTIHAPLTIEGIYSYTHTAPMDSYLVAVMARPGDRVHKGDLLGRLDDTELTMEITSLEYQRDIYFSQYKQLLQQGRAAEAEIARLEAEKTAISLDWARERLGMTQLRSSVDGFLISEDMFAHLGQPVRRGQDLFEITDTANLRVVVWIDESDISDVNSAMQKNAVSCAFSLTAYPDRATEFTVERIHPFAAAQSGANGFELRGSITTEADGLFLRPGMEGHARIVCGERSLLYLATYKLVNRLRMVWWRWT